MDINVAEGKLFQRVVAYETEDGNHVARIVLPNCGCEIELRKIRQLSVPPVFVYGDYVVEKTNPDVSGEVIDIIWHFNKSRCFYVIQNDKKKKSKRFFDEDLMKVE